jgi:hypothetical protein
LVHLSSICYATIQHRSYVWSLAPSLPHVTLKTLLRYRCVFLGAKNSIKTHMLMHLRINTQQAHCTHRPGHTLFCSLLYAVTNSTVSSSMVLHTDRKRSSKMAMLGSELHSSTHRRALVSTITSKPAASDNAAPACHLWPLKAQYCPDDVNVHEVGTDGLASFCSSNGLLIVF